MATIFPREEKAEALFGEILKNPEACHRLMDTFNDSLDNKFAVSSKVYDRFIRVFQKQEKVKMYLASGYCKYHGYDEGSMDVVEYHYNQHLGLLLIYELPDTVKQKVTEAEAYSTVWDIQMKLQHALPRSVVYYGQDTLKDGGTRYDELGVFLPLEHFADRLERHVETATKIVYGE